MSFEKFQSILEKTNNLFVVTDNELNVSYMNPYTLSLFNLKPADISGYNIEQLLLKNHEKELSLLDYCVRI